MATLKKKTEKEQKEEQYLVTTEQVKETRKEKPELLECNYCNNLGRVYPDKFSLEQHKRFKHT